MSHQFQSHLSVLVNYNNITWPGVISLFLQRLLDFPFTPVSGYGKPHMVVKPTPKLSFIMSRIEFFFLLKAFN